MDLEQMKQILKKAVRKVFFLPPVLTLLISVPSYALVIYALTGIVTLMVYENSGFEYPGILIYVMALYAFYAIIMAVRNVLRFRKYGSPVMSAAKAISLTAALVSMLSLETAMLTQFGAADAPMLRRIMTASTGAGISMIVLGMAVFMIVKATKQMRQIRQEKGDIAYD